MTRALRAVLLPLLVMLAAPLGTAHAGNYTESIPVLGPGFLQAGGSTNAETPA
jgi:hypothetical protein